MRAILKRFSCTKDSVCYNIRDKVYGLLGLASDCSKGDIVVDYSLPLSYLCINAISFKNRCNPIPYQLISFSSVL